MRKALYVLMGLLLVGSVYAINTTAYTITGDDGPTFTGGSSKVEWSYTFGAVGDIRSNLSTPGKNIAKYGQNLAVIWADTLGSDPGSGIVLGYLHASYSTDGGATWTTLNLTTYGMKRYYPGVTFDPVTGKVWFVWQEGPPGYPNSLIKVATDMAFPYGVFSVTTLDTSLGNNLWLPSIDAYNDTIVVTAVDIGFGGTLNSYYWVSVDGGLTWSQQRVLVEELNNQDNPVVRLGPGGYVAFYGQRFGIYGADTIGDAPYFLEGHIDGDSIVVDNYVDLFESLGGPLYPGASGWWYTYDMVLDSMMKPHIAVKFGTGTYEYGDVWHIYPTTGSPGSWGGWQADCIVGLGNGATFATQPNIAYSPDHDLLVVIYKGVFQRDSSDTIGAVDIGYVTINPATGEFTDKGPISGDYNVNDADEEAVEIVPLLDDPEYAFVTGLIDQNVTYPEVGFTTFRYIGIEEDAVAPRDELAVVPVNVSRGKVGVMFSLPENTLVNVNVYDASGRKVANVFSGEMTAGTHTVNWNASASGVYFVKVKAGHKEGTARVVVVR